jgi:hypothetical protein
MNLWVRAFYGALLGAILTIAIHPVSRPYLLNAIPSRSPIEVPLPFPDPLPVPDTPIEASAWLHVGAERLQNRVAITAEQLKGLAALSRRYGGTEPDNAFWPMSEAVFEHQLGNIQAANDAWVVASKRPGYDDYQTKRLTRIVLQLSHGDVPQGWEYAVAYRLRSFAMAQRIEGFAKSLVSHLGRQTKPDLSLRFATLLNGNLLRDGSRNLQIMESGVSIVELASHPMELKSEPSIRRLLLAHFEFKEALNRIGQPEDAQRIEASYNENDGWSALTRREDPEKFASSVALQCGVWPAIPGCILASGILGGALWGLGYALRRISPPATLGIALSLGAIASVLVWALTHFFLAVAPVIFSSLFVLLTPKKTRQRPPDDLGPLLWVVVLGLSSAALVFLSAAAICTSRPFAANLPALAPEIASLADARLSIAFFLFTFAAIYLISPLWAMVQRIATTHVFARAAQMVGATLGTLALVATVIVTPLAIYYEGQCSQTMKMLLENEPVYYVRQ